MGSVRDFKDKWYILQPSTQTAVDSLFEPAAVVDEDRELCLDPKGNPEMGRLSKFPIHWGLGHYDHGPGYYHTPSDGMSAEDEEAYGILNNFIDGFFPAQWVTREGNNILDEDGEPMFEARPINTNALVECQSYGKVVELLGFLLTLLIAFFSFFVSST